MRMMPRRPLACAVAMVLTLFAVPLAGCNSGDDGESATPTLAPGSEDALAREIVLMTDDFPRGWQHRPPDESSEPPAALADCAPEVYVGVSGHATGGAFSDSDLNRVSISPAVWVFADELAARDAVDEFVEDVECYARLVREGRLDTDAGRFTSATVEQPEAGAFGDSSAARRITLVFEGNDGSRGVLVTDAVAVAAGRALIEVDGFHIDEPIDRGLLRVYVERQIAKALDEQ